VWHAQQAHKVHLATAIAQLEPLARARGMDLRNGHAHAKLFLAPLTARPTPQERCASAYKVDQSLGILVQTIMMESASMLHGT
jgi:hypothetical protein